jgi:hypothetical protein
MFHCLHPHRVFFAGGFAADAFVSLEDHTRPPFGWGCFVSFVLLTCEHIISHWVSNVNRVLKKKVDIVRKLWYGVARKR